MTTKKFPEPQACEEGEPLHIEMTPVKSSQIASIGHCPKTNTLAVVFKHGLGATYHYPNVTAEQHAKFVGAESLGAHFGAHVKNLPFKKFAPKKAHA